MIRSFLMCAAITLTAFSTAHADCNKKIIELAEGICDEFVDTSGGTSSQGYRGKIEAKMPGLLSKLLNLGGEVGADVSKGEYENILRADIPKALEQGRRCRMEVADKFFDRLCGGGGTTKAAVQPQPSAGQASGDPFKVEAVIADGMGWALVQSAPNKSQGDVLANVKPGEVFYTYVQIAAWWKVRTASGVEGYMFREHLDLLD